MEARLGQSQEEVFDFFQHDERFSRVGSIKRIDTHGAVVFLVGPDAFKIKRAVRYSFMDFSTLEKRRAACAAEITVNRGNAPQIYIETLPVVRGDGGLRLGGEGEIVEWVVHLRRFDEEATYDRLAAMNKIDDRQIDLLAYAVFLSHQRATVRTSSGFFRRFQGYVQDIVGALEDYPDLWAQDAALDLHSLMDAALAQGAAEMDLREAAGFVRRCHGDLHLGNIVQIDETPILFDAIEFDDELATIDILYDLAFVVMDLWRRGDERLAVRLFDSYLNLGGDIEAQLRGLSLLPLYMTLRAAIRARVTAAAFRLSSNDQSLRDSSIGYFKDARRLIEARSPVLVAVGGLSGTGKSTLAGQLACFLGRPPGAVVLRSDIERKRLRGVEAGAHLSPDDYSRDATIALYQHMRHLAQIALCAGQAVILDATHIQPAEREAARELATKVGAPFFGFWLEAPLEALMARVAARRGDASDATPAIVEQQSQADLGVIDWTVLRADQPLQANLADILRSLSHVSGENGETRDEPCPRQRR